MSERKVCSLLPVGCGGFLRTELFKREGLGERSKVSWCRLGGGTEPNILKTLLGYAIATPNLLAVNRQQPYITGRGGVAEKLSALTPLVPQAWKYAGEIRRLRLVVG